MKRKGPGSSEKPGAEDPADADPVDLDGQVRRARRDDEHMPATLAVVQHEAWMAGEVPAHRAPDRVGGAEIGELVGAAGDRHELVRLLLPAQLDERVGDLVVGRRRELDLAGQAGCDDQHAHGGGEPPPALR